MYIRSKIADFISIAITFSQQTSTTSHYCIVIIHNRLFSGLSAMVESKLTGQLFPRLDQEPASYLFHFSCHEMYYKAVVFLSCLLHSFFCRSVLPIKKSCRCAAAPSRCFFLSWLRLPLLLLVFLWSFSTYLLVVHNVFLMSAVDQNR